MKTTNEEKDKKGYLAGDLSFFKKIKINKSIIKNMIMILYNILPDIKEST